ncbi:P-protein [bacterium HR35]|nr:P-protein [bacterium HR35]
MLIKKIVYQGIPGSFSYLAGIKFFGNKNKFIGTETFKEIFELIDKNKADFGIIPIENSIAGSIYENYDLLNKYPIKVVGEIYLRIIHNLLAIKLKNISKRKRLKLIKKVYSHPKALEQCNKFFEKHPWIEKVSFSDTAGAAKFVSEQKNPSLGAIASELAAKIYNLDIILRHIEDDKNNYTRFLVITRNNRNMRLNNPDKCSLIFKLPHRPGSLYRALQPFAENKINLTKIESRPIIGKPFEYIFYLDFDFVGKKLNEILKVIKEFKKVAEEVKILGFYSKGKFIK